MSNIVTRINQGRSLFSFLFIYLCDLGGQRARHIILKGLPLSVTSGDLRRAVMLAGLQGVTDSELARNASHIIETVTTSQFLFLFSGSISRLQKVSIYEERSFDSQCSGLYAKGFSGS